MDYEIINMRLRNHRSAIAESVAGVGTYHVIHEDYGARDKPSRDETLVARKP